MIYKQAVNPEMIEIGRKARRLNQKKLAELTGLTQGTISKMELGLLPISDEALKAFVRALEFPESFFFEQVKPIPPNIIYYRKRKKCDKVDLDTIENNLFIRKHHLAKLLKSVEMPTFNLYFNKQYGDPQTIARIVRQKLKMPKGPIKNLVDLLEDAGVLIFHLPFNSDDLDGEIIPNEAGTPIVYINRSTPGCRQRFTLAHEFGHLTMHTDYIPTAAEDSDAEADQFASEFLMPADDIRYQLNDSMSLKDFADLKRYWKVSISALIRRAYDLECISSTRYRSLNVQMSRLNYKKREPADLDIPVEQPTLLAELIKVHMNELGYSAHEMAKMLSLRQEEFEQWYGGNKFMSVSFKK